MVASMDKKIQSASNMNNFGIKSCHGIIKYFKNKAKD